MIRHLVFCNDNIDLGSGEGWFEVDITDFEYSGGNLLVSARTQNAPETNPYAIWYNTLTSSGYFSRESHEYEINPPAYIVLTDKRPNLQLEIDTIVTTIPPNPAINPEPANAATGIGSDPILCWMSGGGLPSGYNLWLGTDNPPTNIINGADLGNVIRYTPDALNYSQTYYWKIVPYNIIGSAANCPVWSFSTAEAIDTYPHIYGFEEAEFPWGEWQTEIIAGESGFQRMSSSSQPTTSPHTGGWMGYYNCRNLPNGNSARLISPPVDRTPQNYTYNVSFWMFRDSGYSTRADRINIWLAALIFWERKCSGTINRSRSLTPVKQAMAGISIAFHFRQGRRIS